MYTHEIEETAVLAIADVLDAVHAIELAEGQLPVFEALEKGYVGVRQLLSVAEAVHSHMLKATRSQLPRQEVHYAMYQSHYEITEAKRMVDLWEQDIQMAAAEAKRAAIKRSFDDDAPF